MYIFSWPLISLLALGTLTKGPPSIAFQALTLLPWILFHKKWKLLFSIQHIIGILVFILIVGGYFYWYSAYGDSLGYMTRLFKEAAQRTGMEQSFGDVLLGTVEFPVLLIKLLAPWSLFVVFMFRKDLLSVIRKTPILKILRYIFTVQSTFVLVFCGSQSKISVSVFPFFLYSFCLFLFKYFNQA